MSDDQSVNVVVGGYSITINIEDDRSLRFSIEDIYSRDVSRGHESNASNVRKLHALLGQWLAADKGFPLSCDQALQAALDGHVLENEYHSSDTQYRAVPALQYRLASRDGAGYGEWIEWFVSSDPWALGDEEKRAGWRIVSIEEGK